MRMNQQAEEGNKQPQDPNSPKQQLIKALAGQGKGGDDPWESSPRITFVDKIGDKSTLVGRRLRTILKRNNAMEFGGRYRTGKLRTKMIIRTRTVKDRRPFGRRVIKSNKSYAFAVTSDVSGSMFNDRWNGVSENGDSASKALSSLYMVSEALRIAKVPRALSMFGEKAVSISNMTSLPIRWNQISNDNNLDKARQNDTNISSAMEMSIKQLKGENAERKILIVLTDGEDHPHSIIQQVKEATKNNIECIGITIGNGSILEQCFPPGNNISVNRSDDPQGISDAFITVLERTITKSK